MVVRCRVETPIYSPSSGTNALILALPAPNMAMVARSNEIEDYIRVYIQDPRAPRDPEGTQT
jgi:hypothetical protein